MYCIIVYNDTEIPDVIPTFKSKLEAIKCFNNLAFIYEHIIIVNTEPDDYLVIKIYEDGGIFIGPYPRQNNTDTSYTLTLPGIHTIYEKIQYGSCIVYNKAFQKRY